MFNYCIKNSMHSPPLNKLFKQKRVYLMKGLLHVNYHDKNITFMLKRSSYHAPLNNNLINPACGTFQYKTRC